MRFQSATVAAIGAVLLAGCAGQKADTATGESEPLTSPSAVEAPAQPAPPADPCAGAPVGCQAAGTADVDGDGVPDAVGVVTEGTLTTVRVSTATGIYDYQASSVNETTIDNRGVLIGAFPISRERGVDLVLHTDNGLGNADRFVVIGWRGGGLAAVPQPGSDSDTWQLWESHGSQNWVTCASGGSITWSHLTAPTAEGYPVPGGGILETNHWTFTGDGWSAEGSENVPRTDFSYNFDSHTQAFQCEDRLAR